jgi:Domain of unknown function (DUF4157)
MPPVVGEVLRSPGQALEPAARRHAEQRFGADFSDVRVHADDHAASAASALEARAFTTGNHVVFARDAYAPASREGRRLLGHELMHVLQQGRASPSPAGALTDAGEQHARSMEHAMLETAPRCGRRSAAVADRPASSGVIQRQPDPLQKQAHALAAELQSTIAGATWKEIRKRAYPKESAAGIQRAKERKAGTRPDLTGLGRIRTLEHFAAAVRRIQAAWTKLNPDDRVKSLWRAANVELDSAEVPGFLGADRQTMEFKGFFSRHDWTFMISRALIEGGTPSNQDAAELANTTLHESRHAEQQFLAARFSAGVNNADAAAIVTEQDIPRVIADKAVKKKFNKATDPATADLGKLMYKATVTDAAANQRISDDDGLADLKKKRTAAEAALAALKTAANAKTIADAKTARDSLRAQITDVERRYTLYRHIPYEADAHEVGDAAEQAFRRWP